MNANVPRSLLCVLLVMGVLSTPALAEAKYDQFTVLIQDSDRWTQWFYDAPPDPNLRQEIDYVIDLLPMSSGFIDIAICWSTMAYAETGPNGPPPPMTGPQIDSKPIFAEYVEIGDPIPTLEGHITIAEYNPEWIAVDVGASMRMNMGLTVGGEIRHECIPEPATLSLLALVGLAMMRTKRK